MTDREIIKFLEHAEKHEGKINYMYICIAGKITTGIGCVLHSVAEALRMEWRDLNGNLVDNKTIKKAYRLLSDMPAGKKHSYYIMHMPDECKIFLSDGAVYKLAIDKIKNNYLPVLTHEFNGFEFYPSSVKIALLDIIYAVGAFSVRHGWPKLKVHCAAGRFDKASNEVKISSQRPKFNKLRKQMMLDAAKC